MHYIYIYQYTLAIDGSSNNSIEKMNPLTVYIYDQSCGAVCTRFLDICACHLKQMQKQSSLKWMQLLLSMVLHGTIALGSVLITHLLTWDVITLQHANSSIYIIGCPCHIVHNIAGKANDAFEKAYCIVGYFPKVQIFPIGEPLA